MDPKVMMAISAAESGKLALKSKILNSKESKGQYTHHYMANFGEGSVIGLNELLVAQSPTYTTSLTCLSGEGEMYKI